MIKNKIKSFKLTKSNAPTKIKKSGYDIDWHNVVGREWESLREIITEGPTLHKSRWHNTYFVGDVYTNLVLITRLDTYFTFEILLAGECRRVGTYNMPSLSYTHPTVYLESFFFPRLYLYIKCTRWRVIEFFATIILYKIYYDSKRFFRKPLRTTPCCAKWFILRTDIAVDYIVGYSNNILSSHHSSYRTNTILCTIFDII